MKNKTRAFGLDLVRTIAIFFVMSLHYFIYCGFYGHVMISFTDFIIISIRWLFWACVPLFLLLTGYLNGEKVVSKKYYKGIIKILCSYVFFCIITLLFKHFYMEKDFSILGAILKIFDFTAIEYSWYINMYIGLFLLIPFLNILYKNIKTKKEKQILLLILLFIVALPSLVNCIKVRGHLLAIFPDWWVDLYPILYYFIGQYIKEYQVTVKKSLNLILLIVTILLEGIITFFYYKNGAFDYSLFETNSCLFAILISTLIFLLLYQKDTDNKFIRKSISFFSNLSFDIYLVSFICDNFFYKQFLSVLTTPERMLGFYFLLVPANFLIATTFAFMKNLVFKLFSKIKFKNSIYKKRNR